MAINFSCRTGARTPSCDRAWPAQGAPEPASRPRPAADPAAPDIGKRGRSTAPAGPSTALHKPMRRHHSWPSLAIPDKFGSPQIKKGGRSLCRPASLERTTYFRLVIAVRSAENFTTPVGLHQLEPNPPGLIAVTKDGLKLVVL